MQEAFLKVLSFAIVICIGIVFSKLGSLGDGAGRLISKVVFNLTLPCAIVSAFGSAEFHAELLGLVALGLAVTVLQFFLSLFIYRSLDKKELTYQLSNVTGYNIGCFALAFIQEFFPPSAVIAACLFDAGNALMGTGGTLALIKSLVLGEEHQDKCKVFAKTLFSSAAFDAYVILIILGILGIKIPGEIIQLISPMANANAFLSMFMIGLMFKPCADSAGRRELNRLLTWRYACAVLLSFSVFPLLPIGDEVRAVLTILAWAPIPSTGPVYTLWCGGNEGLASMANAISVLVGIVAVTIIITSTGVLG